MISRHEGRFGENEKIQKDYNKKGTTFLDSKLKIK
jgi:hypothetical protein